MAGWLHTHSHVEYLINRFAFLFWILL
jgi:hypothetical protein